MNIFGRAGAGAGLLLLAFAVFLDNSLLKLKRALGIKPEQLEHGKFRPVKIVPDTPAKQAMLGAGLIAFASVFLVGFLVSHGPGLAHAMALLTFGFGAAGTFALSNPAHLPLPQYTFVGVYTGGTSDTSPFAITFSTYNTVFAARCNGVAPVPNVLVVQTPGTGVSALGLTCTATEIELAFTLGEGDSILYLA